MRISKKIVSLGIFVLIAVALSSPAWAAVNVSLGVDESVDPPRLEVINNNARCQDGPMNCIEVKQGTQPHMYFKLNKACQPGGTEWALKRFYIMETEKVWPASLGGDLASEFCADSGTGEVNLNSCGNQGKDNQLKIKNHNRKAGSVYYMVEAEHCTDSSQRPIGLDPEIRNRGGN
jgi:hypothetical protein